MSHNLDRSGNLVHFADSRADAWHQLGQQVGHAMTAAEAFDAAGLAGWNVRKMPLVIPQEPIITPDGVTTPLPVQVTDSWATVRDNPITGTVDYLGVVGSKYTPVQNEESARVLDAIVDEAGGARFETAGALYGGRQTFLTMKLPKSMVIDGSNGQHDRTDWYIAALNSHDGSQAFRLLLTGVRVVCANTQEAAIRGCRSSFSIRHTANARVAIHEARQALGLSFAYIDAFSNEAAQMNAREIEVEEFRRLAEQLTKVADAPSASARAKRRDHANGIVKLFVSSPSLTNLNPTRWAAYQAVTEYADHFMGQGTKGNNADSRALRTITSATVQKMKADAFNLLAVG